MLVAHATKDGTAANRRLLSDRLGAFGRYAWARIGKHLTWVTTQQTSTHWLRHTTLT